VVTQLAARAVHFRYAGGPPVLAHASLELTGGRFDALIGPNGSGKSTLLRCLAGLLRPEVGRVTLGDRDVTSLRPRERARYVAWVPQFLAGGLDARVDDFVFGGRYAHLDRWRGPTRADAEAVEHALVVCDAAALRARALGELSGGQRQRVVIARAVAQAAQVLLVDEPTTSLDPEHQVQVFELLADLARAGRAVLVVTHEINLAAQFVDALTVLAAGRVAARGNAQAILTPEVLHPVYGRHLTFGRDGRGRPFVLASRVSADAQGNVST
jgi:iron complex transport system ATP-binding protein